MAGYAREFDRAAEAVPVFGVNSASAASGLAAAVVDREVYDLMHLAVLASLAFTTASGAPGDEVDVTILVETGNTLNGGNLAAASKRTLKTFETAVVVDANDGAHTAVACVPVNLSGADRYIQATVTIAAGTGAPTVNPALATVLYNVYPRNGVPAEVYDSDGFIVADIAE